MTVCPQPQLIVALDVETFQQARALVQTLSPLVDIFKIGSQLFTACGPGVVRYVQAKGKEVFLDLKFHDIPHTVTNAVSAAMTALEVGHAGSEDYRTIFMLTMHISGGEPMLASAAQTARQLACERAIRKPQLVGITVLTSEICQQDTQDLVLQRARLAHRAGLDGVVASVQEAAMLRKEFGPDWLIVTPGIRPLQASAGDQKRIATPSEAVKNGSSFLVVGRPIVEAPDPLGAAQEILAQMRTG